MTVVGEASILIRPVTTGFEAELRKETDPALGGFRKDAETAGEDAGSALRGGTTKETGKLAGDLEKHGNAAGAALSSGIGKGLLVVGAAAAGAAVEAAHLGEQMQSADASIAAASGTSVASATKIGNAFLDTAGKSEFSAEKQATAFASVAGQLKATEGHALDAAQAQQFMAAAGDLATAKQIDLGDATTATAGIMQAFHLSTKDATDVTNALFVGSTKTGQSVDTLASSIEKVRSHLGPTAGSVQDLTGLLVDMTNQGITGRTAMSGLNTAMSSLVKPTTQGAQAAKVLGLETFNSAGKFVGLQSIITQLAPKFATMTQQQQLQAATMIFGAGAARQMLAVINAGPSAYQKATAAVNQHGAAAQAAAKQTNTLHGQEEVLGAEVTDLGTRIGSVLIPVVTAFTAGIIHASTYVLEHKTLLIALAAVVTGVLGAAVAVFTVNKMAAFGNSFVTASGHVKDFAGNVETAVNKVIGLFGKQTAAADEMATDVGSATAATSTAVEGEATKVGAATSTIEGDNTTAGASFTAVGTSAQSAATTIGTAESRTVSEVTSADGKIEAENEAAAGSFAGIGAGAAAGAGGGLLADGEAAGGGLLAGGLLGPAALGVGGAALAESLLHKGVPIPPGGLHFASAAAARKYLSAQGVPSAAIGQLVSQMQTAGVIGKSSSSGSSASVGAQGIPPIISGSSSFANQEESMLMAMGLSRAGAAGLVGNFAQESSNNPAMDIGSAGKGLASWTGSATSGRQGGLNAYAAAHGLSSSSMQANIGFVMQELQGMPGLLQMLKTTNDPTAAALAVQNQYERPATGPTEGTAHRISAAQAAYNAAHGGNVTATGGGSLGSQIGQLAAGTTTGTTGGSLGGGTSSASGAGHSTIAAAVPPGASMAFQSEATKAQMAAAKQEAADTKSGVKEMTSLVKDVHSTNLKQLTTDLNKTHNAQLGQMVHTLENDGSTQNAKLADDLVKVHTAAMDQWVKESVAALQKAAQAALVTRLDQQAKVVADQAKATSDQIADATKVYLDQQAQAGLTGAALTAAQAQTSLDQVTAANNQAIDSAQMKVDKSSNSSQLVQAQAAEALAQANATAAVQQAQAQSVLDKANALANAASAASTSTTTDTSTAATAPVVTNNFSIFGNGNLTASDLFREMGWALTTGALPVAAPAQQPAAAAA